MRARYNPETDDYDTAADVLDRSDRLDLVHPARRALRSAGLRLDEYGMDRDGGWFVEYDGGGQ